MNPARSSNAPSESGFVLDSFAILALLGAEKGSGDVAALLRPGPELLLMTYVNLAEVVYTVIRERGQSRADAFCAALSQLSGFPVVTGDPEFLQLEGPISVRWIG
jgi:PIN domain nuclease of toxin-antitoxin system